MIEMNCVVIIASDNQYVNYFRIADIGHTDGSEGHRIAHTETELGEAESYTQQA